MTSTFALLAVVVILGCAHSLPAASRESVIEIAQAPNAPDELFISSLRNVNHNTIYHDWNNKLSVLKDIYQQACFIVDLDTGFSLNSQERDQIMATFFPDSDMVSFPSRVGPFVEALCQGANVFWPRHNPPALRPRPAINSPSTINGVNVPPPVSVYRAQQAVVPPPVNVFRQEQQAKSPVVAPPPLNLYLANQAAQQKQAGVATPPPPSIYLAQNAQP